MGATQLIKELNIREKKDEDAAERAHASVAIAQLQAKEASDLHKERADRRAIVDSQAAQSALNPSVRQKRTAPSAHTPLSRIHRIKLSKVQKALPILRQSLLKVKALEQSELAESADIAKAAAKIRTDANQKVGKVAKRGEKAHGEEGKLTDVLLRVTHATTSTLSDWQKLAGAPKSALLGDTMTGSADSDLVAAQKAMSKEMMHIELAGKQVHSKASPKPIARAKHNKAADEAKHQKMQEQAMSKQVRKKLAIAVAKLQAGAASIRAREAGEIQAMAAAFPVG